MSEAREKLAADVLIIGAGPTGLSCTLRLAQLIQQHNQAPRLSALSPENIYVLEKGRELGSHQLSGAILDPRGYASWCRILRILPRWTRRGIPT